WTFVAWGGLHGTYLVASIVLAPMRVKLASRLGFGALPASARVWLARLWVFFLVLVSWVFFRAANVGDAWTLLGAMLRDPFHIHALPLPNGLADFWVALASIAFLLAFEAWKGDQRLDRRLSQTPPWQRRLLWVGLTVAVLWFGVFNSNEFIYFQF
ncbi:MAG: hypothetical protein MI919_17230, partial [Holophagales bacterium]|nr:hypothetical protein [Holophagales bacterium]